MNLVKPKTGLVNHLLTEIFSPNPPPQRLELRTVKVHAEVMI